MCSQSSKIKGVGTAPCSRVPGAQADPEGPSHALRREAIMIGLEMLPALSAAGGRTAEILPKASRSRGDALNELVVIFFLTAGPVLGAMIFLAWLGGLLWGMLSSLL